MSVYRIIEVVLKARFLFTLTLLVAVSCSVAAQSQAARVSVLNKNGKTSVKEDRFLPQSTVDNRYHNVANTLTKSPRRTVSRYHSKSPVTTAALVRAISSQRVIKSTKRPPVKNIRRLQEKAVGDALKALLNTGQIDQNNYQMRIAAYRSAQGTAQSLSGTRRRELTAVLTTIANIAKGKKLTPSRINPLWLTLDRNVTWWQSGHIPKNKARIEFPGSEIVWQYYPGQGLQLQMLANFGKLNGLWMSKKENVRLGKLADELVSLAAQRGSGIAWEYYFTFGGGRPPWVSAMAQATAMQALARSSVALKRPDLLAVAKSALPLFQQGPPTGVTVQVDGSNHYLLYSFAPKMRVLNGFLQSLVGLYDYAKIANDPVAMSLFNSGNIRAHVEVPQYNTGAWSLYARLSGQREADLNYHNLVTGFLRELCKRTSDPLYCQTATQFEDYLYQQPTLTLNTRETIADRKERLGFSVSKLSRVQISVVRDNRTFYKRNLGLVGFGKRSIDWKTPNKPGGYMVKIDATDVAGNRSFMEDEITIYPRSSASKRASSSKRPDLNSAAKSRRPR